METVEFERAVIASVLVAPDEAFACPELAALQPAHFRNNVYRKIFQTAVVIHSEGGHVSADAVHARINGDGPEITFADLGICMTFFTSSLDLPEQAQRVARDGNERNAKGALQTAYKQLDSGANPADVLLSLGEGVQAPILAKQTWADLEDEFSHIQWEWEGFIPRGYVTLIAGDIETGKSLLCLNLVNSMLMGLPWPDGRTRITRPGRAIWLDTEATEGLNIKRAKATGLPLDRIRALDGDLESEGSWSLLERECQAQATEVLVVDSLGGAHMRENDETIKETVLRLAILARNRAIPVLLVHHLRKPMMGEPSLFSNDRIRGFSGIKQFTRCIIGLDCPDTFEPDHRRLAVTRLSFGPKPKPIGFSITEDGLLAFTANAPEKQEAGPQPREAEAFLREYIRPPEFSCQAATILAAAQARGITEYRLKAAKSALGVVSKKSSLGEWLWVLPTSVH